jgi:hypothetical protein
MVEEVHSLPWLYKFKHWVQYQFDLRNIVLRLSKNRISDDT